MSQQPTAPRPGRRRNAQADTSARNKATLEVLNQYLNNPIYSEFKPWLATCISPGTHRLFRALMHDPRPILVNSEQINDPISQLVLYLAETATGRPTFGIQLPKGYKQDTH